MTPKKKGPHRLYDPNAKRHWYEMLYDEGTNKAQQLWDRWKFFYLYPLLTPLAGKMGLTPDEIIHLLFEVTIG